MKRSGAEIPFLLPVLIVGVALVHIFMSFGSNFGYVSNEAEWTLTRDVILSLRSAAQRPDQQTCLRIALLGCAGSRRGCRAGRLKAKQVQQSKIPVVTGRRSRDGRVAKPIQDGQRYLITVRSRPLSAYDENIVLKQRNKIKAPSLYVLNAAALTKPYAVEQLTADLSSYDSAVAIITETHFKAKHIDAVFNIPEYGLFRRDRQRRRGGGVAVYARCALQPTVWTSSADDRKYELLWIRVGDTFIGALYVPSASLTIFLRITVDLYRREHKRNKHRTPSSYDHLGWRF